MKLYELPVAYQMLHDAVSESDGELTPETEADLGRLAEITDDLIAANVKMIANWQTQAFAVQMEATRLQTIATRLTKAIERRKAYIVHTLRRLNMDRAGQSPYGVRVQRNSQPSVKFDGDATKLPPLFQKVTVEIDKAEVAFLHKEGYPLPDGVTVETGYHLRIV